MGRGLVNIQKKPDVGAKKNVSHKEVLLANHANFHACWPEHVRTLQKVAQRSTAHGVLHRFMKLLVEDARGALMVCRLDCRPNLPRPLICNELQI
jgi:hypothetical protein